MNKNVDSINDDFLSDTFTLEVCLNKTVSNRFFYSTLVALAKLDRIIVKVYVSSDDASKFKLKNGVLECGSISVVTTSQQFIDENYKRCSLYLKATESSVVFCKGNNSLNNEFISEHNFEFIFASFFKELDKSKFFLSKLNLSSPANIKSSINNLFYQYGYVSSLIIIIDILSQNGSVDRRSFDSLYTKCKGFDDLHSRFYLAPRQSNTIYQKREGAILYCLHQSLSYITNGYTTRSKGIYDALKDRGYKITVASRLGFPWDSGQIDSKLHLRERFQEYDDDVKFVFNNGTKLDDGNLYQYILEMSDAFVREAQASRASYIISASNYIVGLAALRAARIVGVPFIYEVRGLWEVTESSIKSDWFMSEKFRFMRNFESYVAINSDCVLTITNELRNELISRGVEAGNILLAPNAVSDSFLERSSEGEERLQDTNVARLVYAGSLVEYEGLEDLLEALTIVKEINYPFEMNIIGGGRSKNKIVQLIQDFGLEKNCKVIGQVDHNTVISHIDSSDIVVVPRRSTKVTEMVSALKPLEGMARGKAVLISDVSPNKTFSNGNTRALQFKSGDSKSLAKQLIKLINSKSLRQKLGENARAWVSSERTWKSISINFSQAFVQASRKYIANVSEDDVAIEDLRFAVVADEFTLTTLSHSLNVTYLSRNNWAEIIRENNFDILIVESAWTGADGSWNQQVGYYNEEKFSEIRKLINTVKRKGLVTIFWNKEDPVHFNRFIKTAALCDHIFTTDHRKISDYLSFAGNTVKSVGSCPFYASPEFHNLLPSSREWNMQPAYGGTYYGQRYPDRTHSLNRIVSVLASSEIVIYDRQAGKSDSPYLVPTSLQAFVRGGLPYLDMVQAYKSHPLHVNVNSVPESVTMFSRRVIELAACGTPILSGPSEGVNLYLGNTCHVIDKLQDASDWAEKVSNNHQYRYELGLQSSNAIMGAHTTKRRIAQLLRAAGLKVKSEELTNFICVISKGIDKVDLSLEKQSVPIKKIVTTDEYVTNFSAYRKSVVVYIEEPSKILSSYHAIENLLYIASYYQGVIAYKSSIESSQYLTEFSNVYSRKAFVISSEIHSRLLFEYLKSGDKTIFQKNALVVNRNYEVDLDESPEGVESSLRNMVVASHDFKFIRPFFKFLKMSGFRLLIDPWDGHAKNDKELSKELAKEADIIFCEWMLGNAAWYSKNTPRDKQLLGRFHAQELRSKQFEHVDFERFDKILFVAPHIRDKAVFRNKNIDKLAEFIPNGVKSEYFENGIFPVNKNIKKDKINLGLVGYVPKSKRLDRAIEILKLLVGRGIDATLKIKGKKHTDFPWIKNNMTEMRWYEEVLQRIEDDKEIKNRVVFEGFSDNLVSWYRSIDYILSVSEHESFHFSIADGAAVGCIPVCFDWEGASSLYPSNWIVKDSEEACNRIINNQDDRVDNRDFIYKRYSITKISRLILEAVRSTNKV